MQVPSSILTIADLTDPDYFNSTLLIPTYYISWNVLSHINHNLLVTELVNILDTCHTVDHYFLLFFQHQSSMDGTLVITQNRDEYRCT